MNIINIRILENGNTPNKELMGVLYNTVKNVVRANYRFEISFAKPDGKSKYPQMTLNNKLFVGVSDIKTGIQKFLHDRNTENEMFINGDDSLHNMQCDLLGIKDGVIIKQTEDDEDDDTIDKEKIQKRAETYNASRGNRLGELETNPQPTPKSSKSKKVHYDDNVEQRVDRPKKSAKKSMPQRNSEGKMSRILDKTDDDDLGATFRSMKNKTEDEDILENMFANMVETKI